MINIGIYLSLVTHLFIFSENPPSTFTCYKIEKPEVISKYEYWCSNIKASCKTTKDNLKVTCYDKIR